MDTERAKKLRRDLLEWYDSSARSLPWREKPTPYRVWISEIMLQQTRVETVKPYFEKFMREVPTIEDLAVINDDQLMKVWEGLGYYSRAKNLKRAAQIIVEKYNGVFPAELEEIQSLPGIGPYTAGAVGSIAFGIPIPAVDGNVLRVITRLTGSYEDIHEKETKTEISKVVQDILSTQRAGDFNQALMELGATICVPNGAPKCEHCPIQRSCEGHQQGIAQEIPMKTPKKLRRIEKLTVFIIKVKDRIALRRRPEEGLLAKLWEFPHVQGHLSTEECLAYLQKRKLLPNNIQPLGPSKHLFTHLEWHMIGYCIQLDELVETEEVSWLGVTEINDQYSLPTAFKQYKKYM